MIISFIILYDFLVLSLSLLHHLGTPVLYKIVVALIGFFFILTIKCAVSLLDMLCFDNYQFLIFKTSLPMFSTIGFFEWILNFIECFSVCFERSYDFSCLTY